MKPVFLLLSGKRKSGKDHCARELEQMITEAGLSVGVRGVSHHLKRIYAKEHPEVNFNELLTSGPYKEAYRKDMIEWGESVRDRDPGYFCRLVEGDARDGDHDVFIIPDCRRPTDLEYFSKRSLVKVAVRVNASEEVRRQRGWAFTRGVDDAASECALDSYPKFDVIINNNDPNVRELLQPILERVMMALSSQ